MRVGLSHRGERAVTALATDKDHIFPDPVLHALVNLRSQRSSTEFRTTTELLWLSVFVVNNSTVLVW